jgi:hypothetical protein
VALYQTYPLVFALCRVSYFLGRAVSETGRAIELTGYKLQGKNYENLDGTHIVHWPLLMLQ